MLVCVLMYVCQLIRRRSGGSNRVVTTALLVAMTPRLMPPFYSSNPQDMKSRVTMDDDNMHAGVGDAIAAA
jgi:hypothetical protein